MAVPPEDLAQPLDVGSHRHPGVLLELLQVGRGRRRARASSITRAVVSPTPGISRSRPAAASVGQPLGFEGGQRAGRPAEGPHLVGLGPSSLQQVGDPFEGARWRRWSRPCRLPTTRSAGRRCRSTSPHRAAVTASSRVPVSASQAARCGPIRRGMLAVPPAPGISPMLTSGSDTVVPSAASTAPANALSSMPGSHARPVQMGRHLRAQAADPPAGAALDPDAVGAGRIGAGAELGQIAPAGKVRSVAAQVDRRHRRIVGRQLQGGHQFVAHAGAVGVAPLRPVQGDPQVVALPIQLNHRVGPRVGGPRSAGWRAIRRCSASALQRRVGQRLDHQGGGRLEGRPQPDDLGQGGGRLRIAQHRLFHRPGGLAGPTTGADPRCAAGPRPR